jgi:ankyrin repeat protein
MQDGWTPLCVACNKGHAAVVEVLLKAGADANKGYEDDYTVRGHETTAAFVLNLLIFHFGDMQVHTE